MVKWLTKLLEKWKYRNETPEERARRAADNIAALPKKWVEEAKKQLDRAAMPDKPVKWRWALYGLLVGVAIVIASLLLEGNGFAFAPWTRPGIARNLGISGTLLIPGLIGLLAGLIRDRRAA